MAETDVELFQVTYQMPGHPVVVERGLTDHGAQRLQTYILLGGGWGCRQGLDSVEKIELLNAHQDRFERAIAFNRRKRAADHAANLVRAGTRNGNPFLT